MSIMLDVPSSVANDFMTIAGLVTANTGRRYGDWRQARVVSAIGMRRAGTAML